MSDYARSDIRVYLNKKDVSAWFYSETISATAENLILIFQGIDIQVKTGNLST